MPVLSAPDWERVLAPETPLAETVLRGSLLCPAVSAGELRWTGRLRPKAAGR